MMVCKKQENKGHNSEENRSLREIFHEILGGFAFPRPVVTPEEDKAAWHRHLEEKYLKKWTTHAQNGRE